MVIYNQLSVILLLQKDYNSKAHMGFPGGSTCKESTCNVGDLGSVPGWEDLLEKGTATHSSILSWRIPWPEEPGRLQSMELQESGNFFTLRRLISQKIKFSLEYSIY